MANKIEEYIVCSAYKLPDDYMFPNIEKMNKALVAHKGVTVDEKPFTDVRNMYAEVYRGIFHMITGWRHQDIIWKYGIDLCKSQNSGFMTSKARFVDRQEGMKIAFIAGQVDFKNAVLDRQDANDDFWKRIDEEVKNGKEEKWSVAQRKLIAENVKTWITLYSEDIY